MKNSRAGMSLLGVIAMVAVALSGLYAASTFVARSHRSSKSIELDSDFIDLMNRAKMILASSDSCVASMQKSSLDSIPLTASSLHNKDLQVWARPYGGSTQISALAPNQVVGDLKIISIKYSPADMTPTRLGFSAKITVTARKVSLGNNSGQDKQGDFLLYLEPNDGSNTLKSCSANMYASGGLECISAIIKQGVDATNPSYPFDAMVGPTLKDPGPNPDNLTTAQLTSLFHAYRINDGTHIPADVATELGGDPNDLWGMTCPDAWTVSGCAADSQMAIRAYGGVPADSSHAFMAYSRVNVEDPITHVKTDYQMPYYDSDTFIVRRGCFSNTETAKANAVIALVCCRRIP